MVWPMQRDRQKQDTNKEMQQVDSVATQSLDQQTTTLYL